MFKFTFLLGLVLLCGHLSVSNAVGVDSLLQDLLNSLLDLSNGKVKLENVIEKAIELLGIDDEDGSLLEAVLAKERPKGEAGEDYDLVNQLLKALLSNDVKTVASILDVDAKSLDISVLDNLVEALGGVFWNEGKLSHNYF